MITCFTVLSLSLELVMILIKNINTKKETFKLNPRVEYVICLPKKANISHKIYFFRFLKMHWSRCNKDKHSSSTTCVLECFGRCDKYLVIRSDIERISPTGTLIRIGDRDEVHVYIVETTLKKMSTSYSFLRALEIFQDGWKSYFCYSALPDTVLRKNEYRNGYLRDHEHVYLTHSIVAGKIEVKSPDPRYQLDASSAKGYYSDPRLVWPIHGRFSRSIQ